MNAAAKAQAFLRQGQLAQAEQAFEQLLREEPDNLQGLNVLALAALRRRDSARAVSLLERAVGAHPSDFHSRFHLARALDESGALAAARDAYELALRMNPASEAARIHLAHVLDRLGEAERALAEYQGVLASAQRAGRWVDPATTPPNLRPLVERAVVLIRAAQRERADTVLTQLQARFGAQELRRVAQAVSFHLREEQPVFADARQQPVFFYVPGLPTAPYVPRERFAWIQALEKQAPAIRAELLALLPSTSGRERVFLDARVEEANLRGTDVQPSWNGYYFYRHGERREDNCSACPITAAAMDALPLARIAAHGPEVLFSVFTPGTHLLPHRGVTNVRLVAHLPLVVPADCALRVGGETHEWVQDQVVVFDDTYEHEAWNRSGQTRVVLIFDVWNPALTEIERAAVSELIPQLAGAAGAGHAGARAA